MSILKTRPGFGQIIQPKKGAIVASTVLGSWDPDPDYFFHWFRDSAVIIDALRVLFNEGSVGPEGLTHFADFVRFSLTLQQLNGRTLVTSPEWRTKVSAEFEKYLRTDESLASVDGGNVAADTRVNADGTLDISSWSRPQNDGPATRALALMRWAESASFDAALSADFSALLSFDLAFVLKHACKPCFDIWEEESGLHYYTLCVSAAALEKGADWLDGQGGGGGAGAGGGVRTQAGGLTESSAQP
ncbi:MAG TPA: glycoside hydrolase family 15 protein, partial [Steroidobacteraceae bacterium]|nr:glycoside hydrolase family 15 protein [Steroidobacteraceae bacterium]